MNRLVVSDAQIVFLHVPKTAGTTIRGIAYAHYGEARVAPIYPGEPIYLSVQEFAKLPAEQRDQADLVIGHVEYGFHRHLSGRRQFLYATILRDPVSRCASLYDHLASRYSGDTPPSLSAMLEGSVGLQFNNYQTRILSGVHAPLGKTPRAMLDKAKENVERAFAFVGITDSFNESLLLAEAVLGWPLRPYEYRNISANNPGWRLHRIADAANNIDRTRLEELNTLDEELYDYARARFLAQLHASVPDWEKRIAAYERRVTDRVVPVIESAGSLAPLQRNQVAGWSKLVGRDVATRVRIEVSGRAPQLVEAVEKRDDLRTANVHFAAACGFTLDLPDSRRLQRGDVVRAFNAVTGMELTNSPRVFEGEAGT